MLAAALAAGGCARNDPVLDDPRLARMSPEQRLQVLKQIYEIRRGVVEAERGWDNTPLRTPQAMEKNEREFPSPTYCTARGFWDTGLNPTQRRQQFEAASGGIGLA